MSPAQWPRGQRSIYVANHVRDLIVTGEIAEGSRVNERVLTERLGVSRTPLREAFKILEGEGLVTIEPNRGATVNRISPEDVEATIEVLIGLESVGAEQACLNASNAMIAEVETLHHQMVNAYRNGALMEYFHLNQVIHEKIIDCAGNPVLSRIYKAETARVRRYRYTGNQVQERWTRAVLEHEQILDALKQRQGSLLREILRVHHRNGWHVTRRILDGILNPNSGAFLGSDEHP